MLLLRARGGIPLEDLGGAVAEAIEAAGTVSRR